jgi:hypothetical protein
MTDTTMLYRPGGEPNPEAWNEPIETTIVADEDIEAALEEGWFLHPSDFPDAVAAPGPYDSFLDATVAEIIPLLEDMTDEELKSLKAAEEAGKTRASLITAIDKAIAAKGA